MVSTEFGQTPGLRVPLMRRAVPGEHGFLLYFGRDGVRIEVITDAQAMTLATDLARELGLSLARPTGS
ncbi:hypothetical protein ACIPX0_38255 [Streptomyces sp. NPDC090075]|uniref:hypothetical protein n=1 Tax=Streptomyces sp. NPDC090075 TaxID=3365937 RepID=UPI00381AB2F2